MRADWSDFAKIAAPSPKRQYVPASQAPRQAVNATAPLRVGGSQGAASTHWDPNYKPPKQKYPPLDPKCTDREKASYRNEIALAIARENRFAALRKKYPNGNIPIEEIRKAYNGK